MEQIVLTSAETKLGEEWDQKNWWRSGRSCRKPIRISGPLLGDSQGERVCLRPPADPTREMNLGFTHNNGRETNRRILRLTDRKVD